MTFEYMTEKQFNNLPIIYNNKPKVRLSKNNEIIKRIPNEQVHRVKKLCGIKIDKVVLPHKVGKIINSYNPNEKYVYSQEYKLGFSNLVDFYTYEADFSDKEILLFYKEMIETVSNMHSKGLVSGDIWCDNIIIDENMQHFFTDFDLDFEEYLTRETREFLPLFLENYNTLFLDSNYSIQGQVALSDKMNLWNMILYSLRDGYFTQQHRMKPFSDFESLELPVNIEKSFKKYWTCQEVLQEEEYFLNELDTLIQKQYKLPYRKTGFIRF